MLYSSKEPVKDAGSSWKTGLYKFKVVESELHAKGNIMFKLKTKTMDDDVGPMITEWLNITSEKCISEVNRRLQVILGKTEIEDASELVGKMGHVVLYKPGQYFEAYPFGGFYDQKMLSATGTDSTSDRILEALKAEEKVVESTESYTEDADAF